MLLVLVCAYSFIPTYVSIRLLVYIYLYIPIYVYTHLYIPTYIAVI